MIRRREKCTKRCSTGACCLVIGRAWQRARASPETYRATRFPAAGPLCDPDGAFEATFQWNRDRVDIAPGPRHRLVGGAVMGDDVVRDR